MSFLVPNWPAPAQIKAFSSTRLGGISNGMYDSLNVGLHVGDERQKVLANRQRLAQALELPNEPVWLEQVHSNVIANADHPIEEPADGSYSRQQEVICVVMTADCLPVLLTNKAGDQVAAVHAGWRGMATGIIEKAVASFNCEPDQMIVWAGPCIGPHKFEVGYEVKEQLGGDDDSYIFNDNNKLMANLYDLCEQRLNSIGVNQFTHADACTYTDDTRFFSYRRDGQCGRMASLIWVEKSL